MFSSGPVAMLLESGLGLLAVEALMSAAIVTVPLQSGGARGNSFFILLISLEGAENVKRHGISSPPCGKSLEYCLASVMVHVIIPPLLRNTEHVTEIFLGMWPTIMLSLIIATA